MAHQKKEKPKEFSERMVLLNLKKMKKIQEFINLSMMQLFVAAVNECDQPLLLGEGNESIRRWYAVPNHRSCNRQCKQFIYKGMKGNQNNFLTKQECERKCKC